MSKANLERLISNLKTDPKLVESFKGVGTDPASFVTRATSLGYAIDKKDVDDYVSGRKANMSASEIKPQSTGAAPGTPISLTGPGDVVLTGPVMPVIYAPTQVVVVNVIQGPVTVVNVAQLTSVISVS